MDSFSVILLKTTTFITTFHLLKKSMEIFPLSIFIFRRDLRLEDNTALIAALEKSEKVLPVFIFDDRQLSNPYKGDNSFQFMVHSLIELDQSLRAKGSKLYCFRGIAHEIVKLLLEGTGSKALYVNRDYTPFSRERDEELAQVCRKHGAVFHSFGDALLNEPGLVMKPDGKPYTVFTPFMRRAKYLTIPIPINNTYNNYFKGTLALKSLSPSEMLKEQKEGLLLKGGRKEALELLKAIENLDNYDQDRNIPSLNSTTLLSAHHKFGTLSPRETYHAIALKLGNEHTLINELYWRDFFTHIAYHFPHVFGSAFHLKYEGIDWENDLLQFNAWRSGQTGIPLVDAGMRELIATGYMHNRVRMVVASFLTKDLHIDWRWGERFFANHLIDYDPAVNNGNWQWAASTGCDAQPYFRIFNPWSQQQRFDPECIYIKKWVPELEDFSPSEITKNEQKGLPLGAYPAPIVHHKTEAERSKWLYKNALK
jgi:deoxyribodipyrimidine photo-lyase